MDFSSFQEGLSKTVELFPITIHLVPNSFNIRDFRDHINQHLEYKRPQFDVLGQKVGNSVLLLDDIPLQNTEAVPYMLSNRDKMKGLKIQQSISCGENLKFMDLFNITGCIRHHLEKNRLSYTFQISEELQHIECVTESLCAKANWIITRVCEDFKEYRNPMPERTQTMIRFRESKLNGVGGNFAVPHSVFYSSSSSSDEIIIPKTDICMDNDIRFEVELVSYTSFQAYHILVTLDFYTYVANVERAPEFNLTNLKIQHVCNHTPYKPNYKQEQ